MATTDLPSINELRHQGRFAGIMMMKRLKKVMMLLLRNIAYSLNLTKIYYWAELRVFELRTVRVLPDFWYCWMYRTSMELIRKNRCPKLADWMIHKIPLGVRCDLAWRQDLVYFNEGADSAASANSKNHWNPMTMSWFPVSESPGWRETLY